MTEHFSRWLGEPFEVELDGAPFAVAQYPFDVIVLPQSWEGWASLHSYQVCRVNDEVWARVVKGHGEKPRASKRMLRVVGGPAVRLRPVATQRFRGYSFQPLEDTGTQVVNIPDDAYRQLPPAPRYRVACPATGCAFFVDADKLRPYLPATSGEEDTLKLSRYQRILLRLHPPLELSQVHRGDLAAEIVDELGRFYQPKPDSTALALKPELSFEETVAASRVLRKAEFFSLLISPVFDEEVATVFSFSAARRRSKNRFKAVRRAWYRLGEFYLGSQSYVLRVVRPLDIDESRTAVRLSRDTMDSLGIEDMDVVQLRYGARTAVARAMSISDDSEMRANSFIAPSETLDAVIGIPAGLRAELGVPSINECVEVERDANHMFRKSLNLYLLSALAWLFTVLQVAPSVNIAMSWVVLIFVVSMPVVAYVAAAGKRAQVKDLNRG
ncbi:hypothetical protein [Corynebacterium mayonis]|uniref:hypothetical protein n=1 Tax=Corynebacterium mayonis TaxID=3062461 RepID=UPI0031405B0F